jgi:hypothetical protein
LSAAAAGKHVGLARRRRCRANSPRRRRAPQRSIPLLDTLRDLVNIESGSKDAEGLPGWRR